MSFVRFRCIDPSVADDSLHYGVLAGEAVHCACGCHGTFELNEVKILDLYEPLEQEIAEAMGWPYSQDFN